jgi:hypothetical protein
MKESFLSNEDLKKSLNLENFNLSAIIEEATKKGKTVLEILLDSC